MRNNIVTAIAGDKLFIKTDSVFQYDYGLKLVISGVTLPQEYDVHFSNTNKPSAKTVKGDSSGVLIPDEYLLNGEDVHAWVYLHTEGLDDDGETVYHIQIPVVARAAIAEEQITPIEHNVIKEALEEIAEAVEETQANVTHYPYINENGYWMVYDALNEQFINTGIDANGNDGYSPTISVVDITGGHRVTITDENGPHVFDVMDGDPSVIIDDNAGSGMMNRTWSAKKLSEDFGSKADKSDTVLSTTLSRGRTANSIIGEGSFAFGNNVTASGAYSHAEGGRAQIYYGSLYFNPVASGDRSHAENGGTTASGKDSHAEGEATTASGVGSHAEGYYSVASGLFSHAEGGRESIGTGLNTQIRYPTASGENSHAENGGTTASGKDSHAEGYFTEATGDHSHAEGFRTKASKMGAHAEGILTKADGFYAHAEGRGTESTGHDSHVEGNYSKASGYYSHSEGNYTKATHRSQHVFGEYNIEDPSEEEASEKGTFVEIVGNGTASNAKSNARTLDWDGNERLKGDIYVNCNADGSGGTKLDPIVFATDSEIQDIIDDWEVGA